MVIWLLLTLDAGQGGDSYMKRGVSPRNCPIGSRHLSLKSLFPHFSGLRVEQVVIEGSRLIFSITVVRQSACCPVFWPRSRRVHSRYFRTLMDLPVAVR